jgi:hypothetical protein
MSINRGTLAQNKDGFVQYIYPKTEADLVEYDKEKSVKDKIDSMDKVIEKLNTFKIEEDGSAELDTQGTSDNSIVIKRTLDNKINEVNERIDSIESIPAVQGEQGETGEDGFSPVVNVSQIENGYMISITDSTKTETFNILNGKDGTSVTHSYNDGILGVTSASGTTSIDLNTFVNAAFSDIFFVGSQDEFNAKYGSVAEAPDGLVWIRPY